MDGDISNKTIVVLVVLTVLISVLSTLVVLNEIAGVEKDSLGPNIGQAKTSSSSSGVVAFEIKKNLASSGTGQVVFEIIEAK